MRTFVLYVQNFIFLAPLFTVSKEQNIQVFINLPSQRGRTSSHGEAGYEVKSFWGI